MSTIFVSFICSLNEEETIQRRKYLVTYLFVMIRKSVTISNMAISNEKLNGRKPSILSLLGRLSILTNTYDAVNPCKDSSMFTKLTGTAVRGSFQRKHLKDKQRSHLFWRWRP
jgi:hypothetical protein